MNLISKTAEIMFFKDEYGSRITPSPSRIRSVLEELYREYEDIHNYMIPNYLCIDPLSFAEAFFYNGRSTHDFDISFSGSTYMYKTGTIVRFTPRKFGFYHQLGD